jgi:predicted Rossmann-fold nucleotide-binding protein
MPKGVTQPAQRPELPGRSPARSSLLQRRTHFDSLIALLNHSVEQRFLRREHRELLVVDSEPETLLNHLMSWEPVVVDKWLDRPEP